MKEDLFDLLQDQLAVIPIKRGVYFYQKDTDEFFSRGFGADKKAYRILKFHSFVVTLTTGKKLQAIKARLACFFSQGLTPGMTSVLDMAWVAHKDESGTYKWVTVTESLMRRNVERLKKVFDDHPDLRIKHGFFDEGVIPYKHREGFFIVPLTNGTFAINPLTQEAVSTYSNEPLTPQFHERGDRKFALNKRLTGGLSIQMSSRAICYVTKPIPDQYKYLGNSIHEVVKLLDVDHINSDPSCNEVSNLQYLSRQDNLIKKLDQEMDPRVYPSTWLSPEGKEVRFRSYLQVSQVLQCNLAAVVKVCKGWRKEDTLKGWKLLEGRLEHPLESVYTALERRGVSRYALTTFKNGACVYEVAKKQFTVLKDLNEVCAAFEMPLSGVQTHLGMRGPLVPYRGLVIFPHRYIDDILAISYLNAVVLSRS